MASPGERDVAFDQVRRYLEYYGRYAPRTYWPRRFWPAALFGFARLGDFTGVLGDVGLRPRSVPVEEDDLAALAFDWRTAGDDAWSAFENVVSGLRGEDADRFIAELIRNWSDLRTRFPSKEGEQLQLPWDTREPAS